MADYYYVAFNGNGTVLRYGNASGVDDALKHAPEGTVMQITELEYRLIKACDGRLGIGEHLLRHLQRKIKDQLDENNDS